MGKRPEQSFLQRRYTDDKQAYEKMTNVTNYQRNANQNYYEVPPYTCQNGPLTNQQITNAGEGVEKRVLPTLSVGMQIGKTTMENSMEVPQKGKYANTI